MCKKQNLLFAKNIIIAVILGLGISACSITSMTSTEKIVDNIKTPRTPEELLRNIKIAMDYHLPLREDFYTEKNFEKFFGGKKAIIKNSDIKNKSGYISDYEDMVKSESIGINKISGLSVALVRFINTNGAIECKLSLIVRSDGVFPSFESSERILGMDWKIDETPMSPHRILKKVTDPHGYARINYEEISSGVHSHTYVEFSNDGTLSIIEHSEVK